MITIRLIVFFLAISTIQSVCLAATPSFVIDMDPGTPAIDTELQVDPGENFSVDVVVILPDSSATLSAFGYSIWWDSVELISPSGVTTYTLNGDWIDIGCSVIDAQSTLIRNCSQTNIAGSGFTEGPLTSVVATIDFTVNSPLTDENFDIQVGFYDPLDIAYDRDLNNIIPAFQGGKVDMAQYQLMTSVIPSLNGSISPDCTAGCMYDSGTVVLLNAIDDRGYPFINWTGCDAPSNNLCSMTMNADKNTTAIFDSCMYPARIINMGTDYYDYLQDAFSNVSRSDYVESQDFIFDEEIIINNTNPIVLKAGYNCSYGSNNTGTTTIRGSLRINNGSLTIMSGKVAIE